MECPKCGANNAPLKKTCYNCGSILSGWTVNNVTGEYGYRNPDGSFTKEPEGVMMADAKQKIVDFNNTMESTIPSLPKEIEDFIDEYIEKVKTESVRQYGATEISSLSIPIYRQMMRMGAFIALSTLK